MEQHRRRRHQDALRVKLRIILTATPSTPAAPAPAAPAPAAPAAPAATTSATPPVEAQIITIRTDKVAGSYTVSWQTRNRCDPSRLNPGTTIATDGAIGSITRTVRDDDTPPDGEGDRVEFGVAINDICDYDWSASFVTAAGVTCRITARSLQIINNRMTLAIADGCPSTGSIQPPPTVDPDPPEAPRNVRLQVVTESDGSRTVVATWSPPTDAGGSQITGYTVTISRPSRTFGPYDRSANSRSYRITGARDDTTYTVRVAAKNRHGSGPEARRSITTPDPTPAPTPNRSVTVSLGNTLSGCPDQTKGCRQLIATLSGFSTGTYSGRCMWGLSASSVTNTFANFTVRVSTAGRTTRHNPCSFNGTQGRYLAVIYDNVRSNTIQFAVPVETEEATIPEPQEETVTPSPTAPRPPRNLDLTLTDDNSFTISWDPPASNGGATITEYEIAVFRPPLFTWWLWVPEWSHTYSRPSTTTSMNFDGRSRALYTVSVAATNRIGTGSAVTASIRTPVPPLPPRPEEPEHPETPENLRLQVVTESDGSRTVVATWSPPSSDGGSAITGYKVTFSRPGQTFNLADPSASNRRATITNAWGNMTYTVTVQAENREGLSQVDRVSIEVPCPTDKFDEGDDFGLQRHNKIVATQQFAWVPDEERKLITETIWIRRETEGGQVRHHDSLSKSGCSWVVKGSIIKGDGKVSGNALITNGATVEDDAWVFGNAIVSDARIAGGAWVSGNAEISGGAVIKGTARISGNVRIDGGEITSGTFDGITEYIDAFVEIHDSVYGSIFRTFRDCGRTRYWTNWTDDSVNQEVKSFIGIAREPKQSGDDPILIGCVQDSALGDVLRAGLPDWTDALPYGSGAILTLIKLSNVAKDLEDNEYEQLRDMADHIRTLYKDIEDNELCDNDCKEKLVETVNMNMTS